jgi:SpoVK/Ycf46/Vps4 family AAA+-type ATPase
MMAAFTRPASPTQLTDADFPHVGEDTRYLVALLRAAVDGQERGVNVLLYGPPGTGKTEFAKLLAQQAGLELYEVDCLDKEGNSLSGKERYRSLQVSQAFLKGRARAALLFDEVEDVFPPVASEVASLFGGEETRGARSTAAPGSTRPREQPGAHAVDLQLDRPDRSGLPAALPVPPRARNAAPEGAQTIARKVLGELGVSEAFVSRIAAVPRSRRPRSRRRPASPAWPQPPGRVGRVADRTAARACRQGAGQRPGTRRPARRGHRYDLSLLNVESRHAVPRIVEALKVRPRATMCFYGLPGSGKTALGEHIARSIDKPLMIRRASDLMSKYVGETEQQMAKMFAQAQRESAVLLLDEADRCLQTRQLAVRSYEVTEVNEMLQDGAVRWHLHLHRPTCSERSTRRRCAAFPSRSASCRCCPNSGCACS